MEYDKIRKNELYELVDITVSDRRQRTQDIG